MTASTSKSPQSHLVAVLRLHLTQILINIEGSYCQKSDIFSLSLFIHWSFTAALGPLTVKSS